MHTNIIYSPNWSCSMPFHLRWCHANNMWGMKLSGCANTLMRAHYRCVHQANTLSKAYDNNPYKHTHRETHTHTHTHSEPPTNHKCTDGRAPIGVYVHLCVCVCVLKQQLFNQSDGASFSSCCKWVFTVSPLHTTFKCTQTHRRWESSTRAALSTHQTHWLLASHSQSLTVTGVVIGQLKLQDPIIGYTCHHEKCGMELSSNVTFKIWGGL